MATIGEWEYPSDLYYDREHNWVRMDGKVATIGITQFAQDIAGELVYVEMPLAGRQVEKGEPFMSMESGKWVGRVKSPLAGKVIAANEELEWESTTVNKDPYGEGWLAKIEVTDLAQLDGMMRADSPELAELIAAERAKYER